MLVVKLGNIASPGPLPPGWKVYLIRNITSRGEGV